MNLSLTEEQEKRDNGLIKGLLIAVKNTDGCWETRVFMDYYDITTTDMKKKYRFYNCREIKNLDPKKDYINNEYGCAYREWKYISDLDEEIKNIK